MKNLKHNPELYINFQRLFKSLSNDETRPQINGIYQHDNTLVACDGHTLYMSNMVAFNNMDNKIIDIKPIEKTLDVNHFSTYNLEINREYPKIDSILPDKISDRKQIEIFIPEWINNLKKSKKIDKIFYDDSLNTFTFKENDNTKFCIDINKLARLIPNGNIPYKLSYIDNNKPIIIWENGPFPLENKKLIPDSWLFIIMPVKY